MNPAGPVRIDLAAMLLAAAKIFFFQKRGYVCVFKSNVYGLEEMETLIEKQRKNILASFSAEPVKITVSG